MVKADILKEGMVLKKKGSVNTWRTVKGWNGAYLKVLKQNGMPDKIHIEKLSEWELIEPQPVSTEPEPEEPKMATNPRIRKTISGPCHTCQEYREWIITPIFFEPLHKITFAVECPTCGTIVPQESWQGYIKDGIIRYSK